MQQRPKIIAIVPARDKQAAQDLAPEISNWIQHHGVRVIGEADLQAGAIADALIALGGDGLMMHMAHTFPGLPILGVNFGTVGFLAMVERANWESVLTRVIAGEFTLQDGPTIDVSIQRQNRTQTVGLAVNDVVIRAGFRMIDTELYVDRQYVNTYPGDGMIVASPQGSTAYCMAAGGPILIAGVQGFALTPLSPHSPIRATLVVPEESLIEMVITNDRDARLILDGKVSAELQPGDVVQAIRGKPLFRMIVVEGMSFYDAFRSKFNYMIRPNAKPSLGFHRGG